MGQFSQFQKNSGRCLAAFDCHHIVHYLAPITDFPESPVYYKDHPGITPATEPRFFADDS
jgi:hypothetical protein